MRIPPKYMNAMIEQRLLEYTFSRYLRITHNSTTGNYLWQLIDNRYVDPVLHAKFCTQLDEAVGLCLESEHRYPIVILQSGWMELGSSAKAGTHAAGALARTAAGGRGAWLS